LTIRKIIKLATRCHILRLKMHQVRFPASARSSVRPFVSYVQLDTYCLLRHGRSEDVAK